MNDLAMNSNHPNPNIEVKQLSFIKRLIGIVLSPEETMKTLAQKPRFLFPFLAVGLGMLLLYLIRYPLYVDYLRMVSETAIAQQNTQVTPEQLEASLKFGTIFGLVFTPIGAIAMWLILTGVMFVGTKILKGEGSFKQFMSITGYAYVIMILYFILSAGVSFFSGELMLNTTLGIFVPDLKGSYLYGFLRSIDLFNIWYYVVMSIGVLTISKLSKTKAYAMMTVIYLTSVVIGAFSAKSL